MADKVSEVMQAIIQASQKDLQKIEPTAQLKLGTSIEQCFNRSGDNPDRFASCMIDTQKKVQELLEGFQFKQLFLSQYVQNCISKTNDAEKCKTSGTQIFQKSIEGFLKQFEKI